MIAVVRSYSSTLRTKLLLDEEMVKNEWFILICSLLLI